MAEDGPMLIRSRAASPGTEAMTTPLHAHVMTMHCAPSMCWPVHPKLHSPGAIARNKRTVHRRGWEASLLGLGPPRSHPPCRLAHDDVGSSRRPCAPPTATAPVTPPPGRDRPRDTPSPRPILPMPLPPLQGAGAGASEG
eukprot:352853-Chlamydomonas_euryale.AAC.3